MGTLVGTPQATHGATAAASVSHSYGTAVQAGDVALVAVAGYHDTATITSVISSVAGTVTQVGTLLRTSAAPDIQALLDVYVIVFSAAGTPTFTANYSASVTDRSIRSIVWRGIDTTTPVEATAGAVQNTNTPAASTGNIVQENAGPICVFLNEWGWASNHNHAVGTPSTGWTEWGDNSTGGDNKYQNFDSPGTRTGAFSWQNTGNDFSVIRGVALRDAVEGGEATVSPGDVAQAQALDTPTVTQTHLLTPAEIAQLQALQAPSLAQDHQLGPAEIAQLQALDGPTIATEHVVTPADIAHLQAFDAPSIAQTHLLTVGDIAQLQALDAPGITQDHELTVTDIAQVQLLDAAALTQVHQLAVSDMVQLQSLDAATLIITGTLAPADIAQIQALGAVVMTQDHQLSVADLEQLQALEAPAASVVHAVTVADIAQAQVLEAVTVVVTGTLAPLSLAQLQALEAGAITQTHLLGVSKIVQLQLLGQPVGGQTGYLVVSSIRVLPALSADTLRVLPALTGTVTTRSDGKYQGALGYDAGVKAGRLYLATVQAISAAGLRATWSETVIALDRAD